MKKYLPLMLLAAVAWAVLGFASRQNMESDQAQETFSENDLRYALTMAAVAEESHFAEYLEYTADLGNLELGEWAESFELEPWVVELVEVVGLGQGSRSWGYLFRASSKDQECLFLMHHDTYDLPAEIRLVVEQYDLAYGEIKCVEKSGSGSSRSA